MHSTETPGAPPSDSGSSTAIPHLVEMVVATTRYLGALSDLSDGDLHAPSLLPGWSRGHVVTHLARNADGLGRLLRAAESGQDLPMYASREQRDRDIEAGAARSAHELRVDASASAGRFIQAINELDVAHEDVLVARGPGDTRFPARDIALLRRIEVEVHHADLGLGFTHRDWDLPFAELLLDRVLRDRKDGQAMVLRSTDTERVWKYGVQGQGPEIRGGSCDLAWWVLGRGDGSGLETDADVLPEIGAWR